MVAEDPSLWPRASFDTRAYVIDVERQPSTKCRSARFLDVCVIARDLLLCVELAVFGRLFGLPEHRLAGIGARGQARGRNNSVPIGPIQGCLRGSGITCRAVGRTLLPRIASR